LNWRALSLISFGLAVTLLGLLWLLQGAALVHVRPILCFADCKPLEGRSIGWTAAGTIVLLVGLAVLVVGFRRRRRR
jgi:hypothetical protein